MLAVELGDEYFVSCVGATVIHCHCNNDPTVVLALDMFVSHSTA